MEKKGGGGGSASNIFSIFYTHHRIPNEHMMTINFDTITNNYEVIYVIKTVMKYYLKKIDTSFHQRLSNMAIGKPRVSPLLSLNTSAVIRYLICVYASYFFAG